MSFRVLDDIALADVAVALEADSLPQLFSEAAEALLSVQIANPERVASREEAALTLEHSALDLLLYRFLQELIFFKDSRRWLLRVADITIRQEDARWRLQARLRGESLDPGRHEQTVDVKAVTLHRLAVTSQAGHWSATVVLDI